MHLQFAFRSWSEAIHNALRRDFVLAKSHDDNTTYRLRAVETRLRESKSLLLANYGLGCCASPSNQCR
jgi:hypothetical protein